MYLFVLLISLTNSELARASSTELQQKVNDVASERDSTLQQAQEMSERLDAAEKERDQLQLELESSQNQIEELQFQLEEISSRHNILEQESNAESAAIHQRLETAEQLLSERERELAEANETITTLSDDLLASQGKVRHFILIILQVFIGVISLFHRYTTQY